MAYGGDFTKQAGGYNVTREILDQEVTFIRYIDCTGDQAMLADSYYKIFSLPANFLVTDVLAVCTTAEGAAGSMDVTLNDASTVIFASNLNVNDAGDTVGAYDALQISAAISGSNNGVMPYLFESAGYISLIPEETLDAFKGYVMLKGVMLSNKY